MILGLLIDWRVLIFGQSWQGPARSRISEISNPGSTYERLFEGAVLLSVRFGTVRPKIGKQL